MGGLEVDSTRPEVFRIETPAQRPAGICRRVFICAANLPPALRGQIELGFTRYRAYSVFLIAVGILIVLGLWLTFERTRIGAQIRAMVDNRRMAESLGINVDRLFTITFAFGSGMAAIGGGFGAEFLSLDPQYVDSRH